MKNQHRPWGLRLLAPAVLMVVFVLLAGSVFAQTQLDTRFPFLSINAEQIQGLFIAFGVQWKLFQGFSTGSVPALYYVALAATLVGALAIVFVKALQDVKTIVAWLVIVIVCLFAPYNSKFLFYPVQQPSGLSEGMGAGSSSLTGQLNGTQGFTPQVAAAHVGTTLEVITTDLFNSFALNGIVESAFARTALENSEGLDAGGSWLNEANQYRNACPGAPIAPASVIEGVRNAGSSPSYGGTTQPTTQQPYTFQSALAQIGSLYTNGGALTDFKTPPPAIVLDSRSTDPSYKKGVSTLGEILYGASVDINDDQAVKGMVDRILTDAQNYNQSNGDPSSLYFYIRGVSNSANTEKAREALVKACTTEQGEGQLYVNESGGFENAGIMQETKRSQTCNNRVKAAINGFTQPSPASGAGSNLTSKLSHVNAQLSDPAKAAALGAMPVTMYAYNSYNSGDGTNIENACDPQRGEALFDSMFANTVLGKTKLKQLIESGNLPAPGSWNEGHLGVAYNSDANARNMAKELVKFLNNPAGGRDIFVGKTPEQEKLILSNMLKEFVQASAKRYDGLLQAESLNDAGMAGGAQTAPGLAKFLGPLTTGFAKSVVSMLSNFAGIGAVVTIMVLRHIIDMALMMIIILTPIAFLIGIAIPKHAFGLLVQSCLMILVLKLVPVTFVIVDRVGEIIYRAISLGGADNMWSWLPWADTSFKQGVFLFGIAGLYLSLVGLTMFLLFKLGDTSNIQKMTEIDSAAKKIGDIGEKFGYALLSAAALVGVGGVMGGVGAKATGAAARRAALGKLTGEMGEFGGLIEQAQGEVNKEREGEQGDFNDLEGSVMPEADGPMDTTKSDEETEKEQEEQADKLAEEGSDMGLFSGETEDDRQKYPTVYDKPIGPEKPDDEGGDDTPPDITPKPGPGRGGAAAAGGGGHVDQMTVGTLNVGSGQSTEELRQGVEEAHSKMRQSEEDFNKLKGTDATADELKAAQAKVDQAGKEFADSQLRLKKQINFDDPDGKNDIGDSAREALARVDAVIKPKPGQTMAEARLDYYKSKQAGLQKEYDDVKKHGISGAPGFFSSMGSGIIGGMSAAGGSSDVPYLGNIIKEAVNEFSQAPERARAWSAVGGMSEWRRRKAAAARGEHFDKEVGIMGKGEQYLGNVGIGDDAFRGMMNAARQAANEAAGKNADMYRSLMEATGKKGENAVFTAQEMRDATTIQNTKTLMQNRQMAIAMQTGTMQVKDAEIALDKVGVVGELVGSQATKDVSKGLDELLFNHYYHMRNDMQDGYRTGARTQNDAHAINRFIRNETGTDYMTAAMHKAFSGKNTFFGQRGMVNAYMKLRENEQNQVAEIQAQMKAVTSPAERSKLAAELKSIKKTGPLSANFSRTEVESFNDFIVQSHRSQYVPQIKQELPDHIHHVKNNYVYRGNFDKGVKNLTLNIAADAQRHNQNVDANMIEGVIGDLRYNSTMRSAFIAENQIMTYVLPQVESALISAGLDENYVKDVISRIRARGGSIQS